MEWRRQGASSGKVPGVPGSLHSWLGQRLRWERGSNPSFLSRPCPFHSSSQAAIGLLLHDCLLCGVPETLLPAAIFKIPPAQPHSLPPSSECSSIYRSVPATATTKQAGAQVPGAHGQRRTHPQGVAPGPSEPSEAQALAQPHSVAQAGVRHASCAKVDEHISANTLGGFWHAYPCPLLPEPDCPLPTPALTKPLPTSPIPATPGVGRQLGQASACGSPGHKRQAGDRSTEFFKALMEPVS